MPFSSISVTRGFIDIIDIEYLVPGLSLIGPLGFLEDIEYPDRK